MSVLDKRKTKISRWMWFNLISLAVTAVVLLAVVVGNRGLGGLFARWGSLNPKWMLTALGAMVGYWLLEGWTLHILIGCLYQGVPFRSDLRTAMIGQLYSALTPFASGGQPVQLIYMQRDGLDAGGAGSVLTVKSIVYQLGMMLVALVAIIFSYRFFKEQVPAFGVLATLGFVVNFVVTLSMLMLLISPGLTRKLYRGIVKVLHAVRLVRDPEVVNEKARVQFEIFHQSARRFEKRRAKAIVVLWMTFMQLISMYLVPYLIYRAFGYSQASLVHMVSAVAFVSMVSAFVPLPGGSGGAEGTFVLFLSLFFPEKDLLVALLLWRIITYYLGMLVGALVMTVSRKRQRACIRLPQ